MALIIREGVAADASRFQELHRLVEKLHRAALPARFRRPPAGYAKKLMREALASRSAKIFVAELDDAMAGYVLVRIKEPPIHPILKPVRIASIEELAVDPRARRRGIASRLMKRAERFAVTSGCAELELHVYAFNAGAHAFYGRLGYKVSRTHLSKIPR